MSTKQTGKPSAAAAAKAQVLQQAAQGVSAIATEPPAPVNPPAPPEGFTNSLLVEAAESGGNAIKEEIDLAVITSVNDAAIEPPEQTVPPVTAAAVAKANLPPAPAPAPEFLTVENCTHFQNSEGRVFEATEVLRRLARRQDLKPVNAPE